MQTLRDFVILGGGTAGWMAAAALANYLKDTDSNITVIESSELGTVGVGEATLPGIRDFNTALGIDEVEFIRATQATFKLGIEFNDWHESGSRFFHPFADYGTSIKGYDFYHCWLRLQKNGVVGSMEDYCFSLQLAQQGRFAQPHPTPPTPLAHYHYAFHFDAVLYANFLRRYAENLGVYRIDARVQHVTQHPETGLIQSVTLDNTNIVHGDFFIDCSGFNGVLIEQTLQTGYEDWSHWLLCNSAIAAQSTTTLPPSPYTKTTAKPAGWQWRIPLQHRVGNGYVYCNQYLSDQDAQEQLLKTIDGPAITAPKLLHFVTGRRKKFWNKNCIALGLAAGFMEPLESTSIALIQTGISRLLQFFPWQGLNDDEIAEANRVSQLEFERIRDFLILHYKLNQRSDGAFWDDCRNMPIPDSLAHKIQLFKTRGHFIHYEQESFNQSSWLTLYNGFDLIPELYDHRVNTLDINELRRHFDNMKHSIAKAVQHTVTHQAFILRHCAAPEIDLQRPKLHLP